MISSEGYKAFYGTMRITPKNPNMEPFDLTCDWLYKPEYQCWYGKGRSFMEEICTVLVDLTDLPPNTPLTLEELLEMDGDPAYLDFGGLRGEYVLVRAEKEEAFLRHKNGILSPAKLVFECAGQIYRRKPKEAAQ